MPNYVQVKDGVLTGVVYRSIPEDRAEAMGDCILLEKVPVEVILASNEKQYVAELHNYKLDGDAVVPRTDEEKAAEAQAIAGALAAKSAELAAQVAVEETAKQTAQDAVVLKAFQAVCTVAGINFDAVVAEYKKLK